MGIRDLSMNLHDPNMNLRGLGLLFHGSFLVLLFVSFAHAPRDTPVLTSLFAISGVGILVSKRTELVWPLVCLKVSHIA
jgi:hypothetical protein